MVSLPIPPQDFSFFVLPLLFLYGTNTTLTSKNTINYNRAHTKH